jgi:REP-associated tyrosine transposase
MSRRNRCVLPGVACHIAQRGVDRRETFTRDTDRTTYLALLGQNLAASEVRLLGWCLMSNHVHLIAVPAREDSLGVLLRRVHGRYAQYYNVRAGRSGHLWQNRYFVCVLETKHLWSALAYVERNAVRAGMVERAGDIAGPARRRTWGARTPTAYWTCSGSPLFSPFSKKFIFGTKDHEYSLKLCSWAFK